MAAKKPDYSHVNTPFIQEYCATNDLKWEWKNQANGHMIIHSAYFEAYVWVQRMTVQVRKRDGIDLSGSVATHMKNKIFNAADFTKLLNRGRAKRQKKAPPPLIPHITGTIVIVRVPHGTPPAEARKATDAARDIAKKINLRHERDHYYEKGSWI